MGTDERIRRFKIVFGYLMFFSILFQKIMTIWGPYSIWDFIFKLTSKEVWNGDGFTLVGIGTVIPALLANVLYLIRSIVLTRNRDYKFFTYLPVIGFAAYCISMQPYLFINIGLVIIDFMGVRWLEEREKINAAYEEQKARERAEKEEKKRVKYFPGRYPAEFFKMIRKNSAYGKKGKMVLQLGSALSAVCIIVMITMYSLVTRIHGDEDFLSSNGLVQIFKQAGVLIFFLCILMLTMIISYYIKDQKRTNRLLVILGMRSRTVYLMFAIVFVKIVFLAGIVGMAIGCVAAYLIREIWQSGLTHSGFDIALASVFSIQALGIGAFVYIVVVLLSLGFNQENVLNMAKSDDLNAEVQREKRRKSFAPLFIISGSVLCIFAIVSYSSRNWAESMFLHGFTALGGLLLLIGSITFYLNRLELRKDKYYNKLIASRPFYYRYWKSIWNLFYLSAIHFSILAVFAIQFTGAAVKQDVSGMFPYDIVSTVYDTEIDNLSRISERHGAEMNVYPMFRMTSLYGSDKLNPWYGPRPIQWPQGQHIAISESSYIKLKRALGKTPLKLSLTGEEMHIVYQQDLSVKAHTIDWDTNRVQKSLRVGQPLTYYNTANVAAIFPVRQIKSEERDSLIGAFHQGMQDNLIVLDDEYFESVYEKVTVYNEEQWNTRQTASFQEWRAYSAIYPENMTEGPTQLVCFKVGANEYEGMLKDIEYLDEEHKFDKMWDDSIEPFYGKKQMVLNTETEILFRKLVYLFVLFLLVIIGFFQFYVKFESETREMNWQNIFLKKLGMRERDRKRALAGQMKIFVLLPLSIGGCGGIIFGMLTIRARLYTGAEMLEFLIAGSLFYAIYLSIWVIWYYWVKKRMWRQSEWEKQ